MMAVLSLRSMTFLVHCFTIMVVLGIRAFPATGHEFQVGGSRGWMEPTGNETDVYNDWASRNRFNVADSLYFEYKNDSVLVVDEEGYAGCDVSSPKRKFKDGRTTFTFDRYGSFYFISGNTTHCRHGQRLIVVVMHHQTESTPPSPTPHSSGGGGESKYPPPSPRSSSSSSSSSLPPPPPDATPDSSRSPALLLTAAGLTLPAIVALLLVMIML